MKSIFTFLTIGTLAFWLTACSDAHDHGHAHGGHDDHDDHDGHDDHERTSMPGCSPSPARSNTHFTITPLVA